MTDLEKRRFAIGAGIRELGDLAALSAEGANLEAVAFFRFVPE